MVSTKIFHQAITYETKIRDFYLSAANTIDDERGKAIFKALAGDEQTHLDFLNYSLDQLSQDKDVDMDLLKTTIPLPAQKALEKLSAKIPEKMLGDIKRVLNAALALEIETSRFYKKALQNCQGTEKAVFQKFYELEQHHVDVVHTELDHAMKTGHWFNFMEVDMED